MRLACDLPCKPEARVTFHPMIAVTFALPAESSEFLRRLRNKSCTDRNGNRIVRGTIHDHKIEVLHTGVGGNVCKERIGKFLEGAQFRILISAGFAGALNDKLRAGDLLLAENFSTVQLDEMRRGAGGSPIHRANLLTVPSIIHSTEERKKIGQTTGAAAADMETEFIARACAEHGVPLLSIRIITDTPHQPFPAPPKILFDPEQQRTRMTALAKFFLAHPNRVLRLVQFAKRITRARKTLSNALIQVVREL